MTSNEPRLPFMHPAPRSLSIPIADIHEVYLEEIENKVSVGGG